MTFLPCRVCGSPVTGAKSSDTKSYCCSKSKCISKDTGKNTDKPTVILSESEFRNKINLLTRGY
jgi:endogenous inhibitor of DNA gyrase (YacG/DUF329 family)